MPETFVYTQTGVADGDVFDQAITITADGEARSTPSVPAAKAGRLTTRTDANTGTLTMDEGHGFTDAAKISLFWPGGHRRNVVVGTVSGNSVPIDGGDGDDLPADETDITAMVPVERPFAAVGNNVKGLGISCPQQGCVQILSSAPAELVNYTGSAAWAYGSGVTNPLAGVTAATVKFSHANATGPVTMKAYAAF